jgi:hypothetical protein
MEKFSNGAPKWDPVLSGREILSLLREISRLVVITTQASSRSFKKFLPIPAESLKFGMVFTTESHGPRLTAWPKVSLCKSSPTSRVGIGLTTISPFSGDDFELKVVLFHSLLLFIVHVIQHFAC